MLNSVKLKKKQVDEARLLNKSFSHVKDNNIIGKSKHTRIMIITT